MGGYSVGLLLLARPFEVWLASYMLLKVIERENTVSWINYILLGMNAFATIVGVYGLAAGRFDSVMGSIFGAGLGAVLIASSVSIWILWIFVWIYGSISNNRRGVTVSTSSFKNVDRIMLYFVVPASILISFIQILNTIIGKTAFKQIGATVGMLVAILVIAFDVWYLIVIRNRLRNYIVFSKREIEVWKGDRQRIYRYNNITSIEQLETKTFFNCKYKLVFKKGDNEDTVVVNDERVELVLEELLKHKIKRNKDGNDNVREDNS